MNNTYVFADTHGRFDLVKGALAEITKHANGENHTIIVTGDFVDRGPESRQIIECFMAGPASDKAKWIILQGNHEQIMLDALSTPHLIEWWVRNGGGETLRSYGYVQGENLFPLKFPVEHLRWLNELPVTHRDDHRIYVHAGVPFDTSIEDAKKDTMQWMLYAGFDPRGESAQILPDVPHISGKHIVHGHEQSADHPLLTPHRTNLDTFAWATGRLAIGVFDDEIPGGPVELLFVQGPRHRY